MNTKVAGAILASVLKLGASQLAQRKLTSQIQKEANDIEKDYATFKNVVGVKAKLTAASDIVVGTAKLGAVSAAHTGVSEYTRENGRALTSRAKGELSSLRTNIGGEEGSIGKALQDSFSENRWL